MVICEPSEILGRILCAITFIQIAYLEVKGQDSMISQNVPCTQNRQRTIDLNSNIHRATGMILPSSGDIQVSLHQIVLKKTFQWKFNQKDIETKKKPNLLFNLCIIPDTHRIWADVSVQTCTPPSRALHFLFLMVCLSLFRGFPLAAISAVCTEVLRVSRTPAWGRFM